ncbi:MAG: exodeoxyribonuclease VII small subunit [Agathobacter sp.]|nr:exodeoxyribonuclease VII small subunit [Agathobacter sp.]
MKMNSEKTVSLEERFEHIEEIIEQMETGDITLDKSFELYKNGLEEIKVANAMLDDMEKAMLVMNEDGSLEEF